MRILLAQINPIIGDIRGNTSLIKNAIDRGREKNVDIVLFPELSLPGYPPEDFLHLPHFQNAIECALEEIIQYSHDITAIVGTTKKNPIKQGNPLYNSAAIITNTELVGYQDKTLLPNYDVYNEKRYFEPAKCNKMWNIGGKKIGITICEDIWQESESLKYISYHKSPLDELLQNNPDVVLNLSASPFSTSKYIDRFHVAKVAAKSVGCPLILCNQVGGNDSLIFDGRSLYVNKQGELLQLAKGFEEDYLLIDLTKDSKPIQYIPDDMADLYAALVLGLRDYFKKSGFEKACLGISGGIDSSVAAALAVEALGKENILGVSMPSKFSSEGSFVDAKLLVKNLGIAYKIIPIHELFQAYLNLLEPQFNGKGFDVTEENLQPRIRGMILMALSNKHGYIVLSTGNKSELAMGYATLYGDMCGGLGVLSDVTKNQVYSLAQYINRNGEVIPQNIITKPPSAELRPNQKDSDSLPDYAIVDTVVHEYIVEHLPPKLIASRHNYSIELVEDLIDRIHRNEYKRRQSPPGLRVSERAFSVGRRFPIVQHWRT